MSLPTERNSKELQVPSNAELLATVSQVPRPPESAEAKVNHQETHIDEICDVFVRVWRSGERPRIEDYLGQVPGVARTDLLEELLREEFQLRRQMGESVTAEDYLSRFPHNRDAVERAIGFHTNSGSTAVAGAGDRDKPTEPAARDSGMRRLELPGYVVLGELGRGGMGVVYKARQVRLNRTVALKMILGTAHVNDETLARFQREAEAVAQVQHPNIVQIYEIGDHEGLPFFSLEFVEGGSLDRLGSGEPFPSRDVAGLVETIARAVHFAHERGIVHRDLKPANILLARAALEPSTPTSADSTRPRAQAEQSTLPDRAPAVPTGPQVSRPDSRPSLADFVPKITDFGLAKQLEGDATATRSGAVMGTPSYMAPEQAAGRTHEIGTLADVYAFGAILYSLLTGRPPFRAESIMDTLRLVIESEPISPRLLNPTLDRDLETICLKCLEKDPQRRYASALDLASELLRFRTDMPILARPISRPARVWRLCKRRPLVSSLAALVVLSLITGTAVSSHFAVKASNRATLAEDRGSALQVSNKQLAASNQAEQQATREANLKREEAEQARDETQKVLDYLVAAFRKSDPDIDGETLTVAALFGQATEELETSFPNQPLIQARLLNAIGSTYASLGLYEKCVGVAQRARDLRRSVLGEEHEETLLSMNNLAMAYLSAGRLEEALRLHQHTLDLSNAKLGPKHLTTLVAMNSLANAYSELGKLDEALPLYERTLELMTATLGAEDERTLMSMNNLGDAYESAGRLEEALALMEQTVQLCNAVLGAKHSNTLASTNNLAAVYKSLGRPADATLLLEQVCEVNKAKFGPEHPKTLMSMGNLATAYVSGGRLVEALTLHEQTLELMKAKIGLTHPLTLTSMNNLARTYLSADRHADGLPLLEQTVELSRATLGPEHPSTLKFLEGLASAYESAGRLAEALTTKEQTLEQMKSKIGLRHPATLRSMNNLAVAYWRAKRLDRSIPLFEQNLPLQQEILGDEDSLTQLTMFNLAVNYRDAGRHDEAIPLLEKMLEVRATNLGADHPDTIKSMGDLAQTYLSSMQPVKALPLTDSFIAAHRARAKLDDPKFADILAKVSLELIQHRQCQVAESYLRECLKIREKKLLDDWSLFDTKSMLGAALAGQKKFPEAEPLLIEGYSGMKEREATIPPTAKIRLSEAVQRLIDLYVAWDKLDQAAEWRARLEEAKP